MIERLIRAAVTVAATVLAAGLLLATHEAAAATPTAETTTYSAGTSFGATQGIGSWFDMKLSGGTYSYLSQYRSAYPAQWEEPGGYPHVRDYLFHPQTSAAAVKKWVAQQAGNVTITGTVGKLDSRSSGVIATISKNTTVLWSATVPAATYVTPTGVFDIHVEPGDALYFAIGVNGSMNYDETTWPLTVTETTALTIPAASYDGMSGVTTFPTSDPGSGTQVGSFDAGDYLLYRGINLSGGYKTLQARLAAVGTGARFEVRLDSLTGPVASTFTVTSTDSWSTFETQSWPFSTTATGVHDLYVRGLVGLGIADFNWLRLAGTNSRGATEPFTSYEAERGTLGGGAALNVNTTVQQAASGKSYVHLAATDQYVQWAGVRDANRLILRYSIPQGASGTLGLYVNGIKRTDLALSSTFNYDTEPGNTFIRSFDDQDFAVEVNAGDTVRLQKDSASTLAWYGIDLIDLETATAPLPMPSGYLSVKDAPYNAKGDGVTDDTDAIQAAVNDAAASGQNVWLPPGTYTQGDRIAVPSNVNVKGAGIWWSHLHAVYVSHSWAVGFMLNNNTTLSDLRISGSDTQRNGWYDNAILTTSGAGQNDVLANLWVQHTTVFTGWTDYTGSTIQNCRVYDLYADGIHWGDGGPSNNLAVNNYFRGMGDDSIAQVNFTNFAASPHGNIAQFNTVIASYWGRGMADIGGNTLTYRDNVIDSTYLAGMMVATEYGASPYVSYPINGLKFQRNTINLASHTGMNHAGLHFWPKTNLISGIRIDLNVISNGLTNGIWIDNTSYGDDGHTLFDFNTAQNNATGNYTNANTHIVPTLTQNVSF